MYETHSEKKRFFLITQFFIIISVNLFSCCCCLVAKSYPTLLWPPWTAVHQAPLSMEFPRQEDWSGLPFLSPEDLPNSRIKSTSPALAGGFFTRESPSFLVTTVFLKIYLFGCVGSYLWHMGNLLHHVRSFVAVHEHRLSSCDAQVK